MTKVQRRFRLQKSLDETLMQQIADANSIYGIERIILKDSDLLVEFDATRLNAAQVESALRAAGIPVEAV
jgi:hypothetical protein